MFYDCQCGRKYSSKKATMCKKCAGLKNSPPKINWPSKDMLQEMVNKNGMKKVAKDLGVSETSVRKRLNK